MGEDSSSWVRRAKFSQTVYHKWNSRGRPSVRDCECELDLKLKNLHQELKDRSSNLELKQKSSSSDLLISVTSSSAQLHSDLGLKPKASILEPSNEPSLEHFFRADNGPVLKAKILNSGLSVLSNSSRVQSGGKSGLSLEASRMLSVPFSFQPDGNPSNLQPRGLDLDYLDSSDFSFYPGGDSGLNPKSSESDNVSVSGRALPKRRSLSPLPTTILSDAFKEARSTGKRFSSPQRSRKDSNKPPAFLRFSAPLPQKLTPFQHLSSNKAYENLKTTLNFNISDSRMVSVSSGSTELHPNSHNSIMFTKRRNSKLKERSKSPNPTIVLSDAFKDARSIARRFSTPPPGRKKADKTRKHHKFTCPSPPNSSPHHHVSSVKAFERLKSVKDSLWAKYFANGEGRVSTLEITEKLTVDLSKLYLGLRFASGAHGRLYRGVYRDQPVAVKIIRQPDDDENGMMAARLEKHFTREITFLSHLNHRNVIKLAGACGNPPVFCIITEYLSGGSLRAFFHKLKQECLPLPKLIAISLDIARGMAYIHSQGVIHRDLKPENILFDQDFRVKIVDFGTACKEGYCDASEDAGTYRWMAPEMIKCKAYGRKVDVYSFGLLLWEMVTGTIPYEDMTPIQAAFAVVNKNLRPVIPADCPAPLQALIEQCWDLDPEKRPEFSQIVKVLEQFESALACEGTLSQL